MTTSINKQIIDKDNSTVSDAKANHSNQLNNKFMRDKKMINLRFNEEAKKLGAKWDATAKKWIASEFTKQEFKNLEDKYFNDLVAVEVKLNQTGGIAEQKWGKRDALTIGGYIIVSALTKHEVKLHDIAIMGGNIITGGSWANPTINSYTQDLVIRMKMSRQILTELKQDDKLTITEL